MPLHYSCALCPTHMLRAQHAQLYCATRLRQLFVAVHLTQIATRRGYAEAMDSLLIMMAFLVSSPLCPFVSRLPYRPCRALGSLSTYSSSYFFYPIVFLVFVAARVVSLVCVCTASLTLGQSLHTPAPRPHVPRSLDLHLRPPLHILCASSPLSQQEETDVS